jgi:hypothetical protein
VTVAAGSNVTLQLRRAFLDDARGRLLLGARGLKAWRDRGYPPAPRFPAPVRRAPAPRIAEHAPSGK